MPCQMLAPLSKGWPKDDVADDAKCARRNVILLPCMHEVGGAPLLATLGRFQPIAGCARAAPKSHNSRRLESLLPFTSDGRVRCLLGSASKVCLRLNRNRTAGTYADVMKLTGSRRACSQDNPSHRLLHTCPRTLPSQTSASPCLRIHLAPPALTLL
jgi:hypothetical protein